MFCFYQSIRLKCKKIREISMVFASKAVSKTASKAMFLSTFVFGASSLCAVSFSSGVYFGAHAGVSNNIDTYKTQYAGTINGAPSAAKDKKNVHKFGGLVGVHVGYTHKISQKVFWAAELDIDQGLGKTSHDFVIDATNTINSRVKNTFGVTPRFSIGKMVSTSMAMYGIAGVNLLKYDVKVKASNGGLSGSLKSTKMRVVAGAGLTYGLSKSLYVGGELLGYVPVGSGAKQNFTTAGGNIVALNAQRASIELVARVSYKL